MANRKRTSSIEFINGDVAIKDNDQNTIGELRTRQTQNGGCAFLNNHATQKAVGVGISILNSASDKEKQLFAQLRTKLRLYKYVTEYRGSETNSSTC